MKNILILAPIIFLYGCANPLYISHSKIAINSETYFKDKTECKYYANTAGSTTDPEYWTMTFYECMKGRGYYAVDKNGNKINYKWCDSFDCFP